MPVQGRKFVIVGGAGLVGSALAHELCEQDGVDVIICDDFGKTSDYKWAGLPSKLDDVWAPSALMDNLDKAWREIAGVVVLADAGHQDADFDALFETSFHLPRRIWDYCVAKQRPIYWASTTQVYGTGPSNVSRNWVDVASLKPITAFGRAKQAFDVFAARQGQGPDAPPVATGFRLASIYGASEAHKGNLASLPVRALNHVARGQTLALWPESGEAGRDWAHVEDVARALAALVMKQDGGFFDIGTGTCTTAREMIETVTAITGQKLNVTYEAPTDSVMKGQTPANMTHLVQAGVPAQFASLQEGLTHLWQNRSVWQNRLDTLQGF